MKKINKNKKGFTLVELLFVMTIISILAGIGFYNLYENNKINDNLVAKTVLAGAKQQAENSFQKNKTYLNFSNSKLSENSKVYEKSYCLEIKTETKTFSVDSIENEIKETDCSYFSESYVDNLSSSMLESSSSYQAYNHDKNEKARGKAVNIIVRTY